MVPSCDYAGFLLVSQHRYFLAGGSYDWYWLVSPEGQKAIAGFKIGGEQLFFPNADAPGA